MYSVLIWMPVWVIKTSKTFSSLDKQCSNCFAPCWKNCSIAANIINVRLNPGQPERNFDEETGGFRRWGHVKKISNKNNKGPFAFSTVKNFRVRNTDLIALGCPFRTNHQGWVHMFRDVVNQFWMHIIFQITSTRQELLKRCSFHKPKIIETSIFVYITFLKKLSHRILFIKKP